MGFFNKNKGVVTSTTQIDEHIAWQADEYMKTLTSLNSSYYWLTKVLDKKATIHDRPTIERLLTNIKEALERAEEHHINYHKLENK
jgi:hypothetical protein